jgi:prepilin-type N-terminal cleavage/methylation domain-containing protein
VAPHHGITLVEVLVSIVILAAGAVGISEALARAADASSIVDGYMAGHLFALSKMAEVEQTARTGEPVEDQSGTFLVGREPYRWQLTAVPIPDAPTLRTVELAVEWRRGPRTFERRLSTLVSVPDDSLPIDGD